MQRKAVLTAIVVVALGGCVGPEGVPATTGSVRPTLSTSDVVEPADKLVAKTSAKPKRSLADAVTSCLDRKVQVQTPAFRRCVSNSQWSAAPRTEAMTQTSDLGVTVARKPAGAVEAQESILR